MKRITLLFLLGFLWTCTSSNGESSSNIILKIDIQTSLKHLASDELEGRRTGSKGIERAATYIETIFKKNDIKSYFKTYRDSFNVKGMIGYNIVGYLEGNDSKLKNEFIILGAHYDHLGKLQQLDGDDIANGANDDASGTVAVLELAKYFSNTKSNKRSILFTLFAAEELGLRGSFHLAKRLKKSNLDLYTMVNFEMIGVPRDLSKSFAYVSGYDYSNIARKLNEYSNSKMIGVFPKAKELQLFKRSDNYPFYKEFNVPAHTVSSFDFTNFNYYHHVDDEADKIDFDHMTKFIRQMIPVVEGMSNSLSRDIKLHNQ